MKSRELSIEEYIARQPEYDKRRRILHPLLAGRRCRPSVGLMWRAWKTSRGADEPA